MQSHPQLWFQQDGATAHTARDTMATLRDIFGNCIISPRSVFSWPLGSPDLTPPDCFLWVYLKERMYVNKPHTISQPKNNICDEIRTITPEILRKVMENVRDIIFHV